TRGTTVEAAQGGGRPWHDARGRTGDKLKTREAGETSGPSARAAARFAPRSKSSPPAPHPAAFGRCLAANRVVFDRCRGLPPPPPMTRGSAGGVVTRWVPEPTL